MNNRLKNSTKQAVAIKENRLTQIYLTLKVRKHSANKQIESRLVLLVLISFAIMIDFYKHRICFRNSRPSPCH